MANIAMSQITVLEDPNIQRITESIALESKDAVEKVAVSFAQANEYPLTQDAKSIERILESRFNALPQTSKLPRSKLSRCRSTSLRQEGYWFHVARFSSLGSFVLSKLQGIEPKEIEEAAASRAVNTKKVVLS